MRIFCLSRSTRVALMFTLVVFSAEGYATSNGSNLDGSWILQSFDVPTKQLSVSGVMVVHDKYFSLIYYMCDVNGVLSSRSHGGTYRIDKDKNEIGFDVYWWLEKVDGESRILPAVHEVAQLSFQGGIAIFDFGESGAQRWKRHTPHSREQRTSAYSKFSKCRPT